MAVTPPGDGVAHSGRCGDGRGYFQDTTFPAQTDRRPCWPTPGRIAGGLRRALGAFDLTLLGIGAIIGAGIFVLTGVGARTPGPA